MTQNLINPKSNLESATERLHQARLRIADLLDGQPTRCLGPGGSPLRDLATPRVPGYEILEELGRGGMGVVYKAWQHSLERTVALKVILDLSFASQLDLERFRAEAMAVARLHHPHLLNIYEIGDNLLTPFYAMEYMEGGSLSRRLHGRPIDPKIAAGLVRCLAEAMDYAHKNGIVHRDLKPANILLSGNENTPIDACVAKIADFGIAKNLHEESSHTRTGDVLGTPHYMAPEQATGMSAKVGPTADVYSLGAILYELLTGRTPFHGHEGAAVFVHLTNDEPARPSQFVRNLPADVQTICLKCLEKDPNRRYSSAGALANDLGRFLQSEPIQAKPASLLDRAVKWAKRRPGRAAIIAMTLALTLFGFGMITVMWRQAVEHAKEQDATNINLKAILADDFLERGIHLAEKGDGSRGMHLMLRALELTEEIERTQNKPSPLAVAIRLNLAAWSQSIGTRERPLHHDGWVWDLAFTPDGKFVLSAGRDHKVKIWETATGQQVGTLEQPYPVWGVALNPDGTTLITLACDDVNERSQVQVWTADPASPGRFTPHGQPMTFDCEIYAMKLNATGDRLWLGSYAAGKACLLAVDNTLPGNGLRLVARLPDAHNNAIFSPDGSVLATIGGKYRDPTSQVFTFDARTGAVLGPTLEHPGPARSLGFSKDGRQLIVASATDRSFEQGETSRLHVWNWADNKCLSTSPPIAGRAKTLTMAPSGQMLAVSHFCYVPDRKDPLTVHPTDGNVALWQLDADGTIHSYGRALTIGDAVWSIAFSPDSRLLLTGSRNSGAYLWCVSNCEPLLHPVWHEGNCVRVAFRPDGRQAATASAGGNNSASGKLWDVPSFAQIGPPMPQPEGIRTLVWQHDGKAAWVCCGRTLCQWDPLHGTKTEEIALPAFAYFAHATGDDRRLLFDLGGDGLHTFVAGPNTCTLLPGALAKYNDRMDHHRVHRSRQWILRYRTQPSQFQFLDLDGNPVIAPHSEPGQELTSPAMDLAGNLLAMAEASIDQSGFRIRIYDLQNTTPGPNGPEARFLYDIPVKRRVADLAFSPDASRLAIADSDRQVRIINLATGDFEGSPLLHETRVHYVCYVGANDILATAGDKGRILFWHAPTGKRIGPAIEHGADVMSISLHPEGKFLLTGTVGRMAVAWGIPQPAEGSVEQLRAWIETMTGIEMKDHDALAAINGDHTK